MTDELRSVVAVMVLALGFALLSVLFGARRLLQLRGKTLALADEHERVTIHLESRVAAQKHQAQAEQVSGIEQIDHFQHALGYWRQAYRTRKVGDRDTERFCLDQIKLVEARLAELGVPQD